MNAARIVVLTIALGAGGVAAYLASGFDKKPPPNEPIAQLQTADVLVAKSDIGLGQTVTAEALQWQTWPAATASNSLIRRSDRPQPPKDIAGPNGPAPFMHVDALPGPTLPKPIGPGARASLRP